MTANILLTHSHSVSKCECVCSHYAASSPLLKSKRSTIMRDSLKGLVIKKGLLVKQAEWKSLSRIILEHSVRLILWSTQGHRQGSSLLGAWGWGTWLHPQDASSSALHPAVTAASVPDIAKCARHRQVRPTSPSAPDIAKCPRHRQVSPTSPSVPERTCSCLDPAATTQGHRGIWRIAWMIPASSLETVPL